VIGRALGSLLLALAAGACSGPAWSPGERPRLVVVVVLDQVGSWILDHHEPLLLPGGLVRRVREEGVFHRRVVFDHAATITAVGHAAIFTGRPPRDHGIVANTRWERSRGKAVAILDDGTHPVLGLEARFTSPTAIRTEGVADVLRAATGGRGRVVAVSMKERGAVIAGGQHPTRALWYEPRLRGFTTSSWYGAALPRWVQSFTDDKPLRRLFRPWLPHDVGRLAALSGKDDAPGEGGFRDLGPTFPHDLRRVRRPAEALMATPQSTEHLLALARRAVKKEDLGDDDVPDLLTISVSGTDYVGHVWGPESWEMADNLVRVDLALGELYAWLAARGPVAFVITADHGAPPLPESPRGRRMHGRRVLEADLTGAAERGIDEALGAGEWVQAYLSPYLYLRPAALAKRDRAVAAAVRSIRALPGIAAAYDVAEVRSWASEPTDALRARIWRSVAPDRGGDIYVAAARGVVLGDGTPPRSGSDHGTPWDHDTDVPVLALGAGVGHLETRSPLPMSRVAATIAALLGLHAPAGAPSDPLPGLRRRSEND